MIKHIVMWKLHKEANGQTNKENAIEFKKRLEELPEKIDALESLEVGIGYKDPDGPVFDLVLTTTHVSKKKLEEYAAHPDHQLVVAYAVDIVEERRVVDYEIN
jgi:hypothetical protein